MQVEGKKGRLFGAASTLRLPILLLRGDFSMKVSAAHQILAVVSTQKDSVTMNAPTFIAKDTEHLQEIATLLSRILLAAVHEITCHTLIIVKH